MRKTLAQWHNGLCLCFCQWCIQWCSQWCSKTVNVSDGVGCWIPFLLSNREPQSVQSVDPGDSLGFSQ